MIVGTQQVSRPYSQCVRDREREQGAGFGKWGRVRDWSGILLERQRKKIERKARRLRRNAQENS